ncbi:hypothetical protein NIIDMKKI_23200 [Mycobacterium kansasii]|uniref:Modulator of DNA gyrase family protein n=1 Tax=Mycobacterium kansasii TaxID=1768 RepID=A0A7G1I9J9_MYCKA|nr:hypothetical protein NIIDMKKI_23200 [Mycobacterium kansasii]
MITAQHVVNIVLTEAAQRGRADETMVLVVDRTEATLRWAGNSMTTNGLSTSRSVTVISIVRQGDNAFVGAVETGEVDPSVLPGLVAASQDAARSAPKPVTSHPCWPTPGCPSTGMRRFPAPVSRHSPASRLR